MRRRDRRARSLEQVARCEGIDPTTLLREVAEFRVALDAELTVAAAAVEAGHPDIAAGALDGASHELDGWAAAMAPPTDMVRAPRASGRRRYLGTAIAAGLVGLALGLTLPAVTRSHVSTTADQLQPSADTSLLAQANEHYRSLAIAADAGDPSAVVDAARTLQSTVSQLVLAAQHGDTVAGQRAAQILLGEQALMAKVPAVDAAALLAEQHRLTTTLQAALRSTLPLLASGHPSPLAALLSSGHLALPKGSPTPLVLVAPATTKAAGPSGSAHSTTSAAPTTAAPTTAASSTPAGGSSASPPLPLPGAGASQGDLGGLVQP